MLPTKSHRRRWIAAAIGLGGAVAIGALAARRAKRAVSHTGPVTAAVTINRPAIAVYELFRDFSQLPVFMDYLASVEVTGERTSTWTAKLPVGGTVVWDADIVEDFPGKLIVWQSRPGSRVQTRGRVTFERAPGRDMTEVRVEMQLGVPGFAPSKQLARFLAAPEVKGDMRRLKQVMETGEVLRSDAGADAKPAPPIFIPNPSVAEKGVDGVQNSLPHVEKLAEPYAALKITKGSLS